MNEMSAFTCKVCGNTINNKSYLAREMMFGLRDEFVYFQCSNCNCLQIAEFPANIAKYYSSENYYSFEELDVRKFRGLRGKFKRFKTISNIMQNSIGRRIFQFIFKDRNTNYLGKLNLENQARILDVGCGNGSKFLYPIYESGFRNVAGCDPFIESDITFENGLRIKKNDLSEINSEWDLICFNHSFEHIGNPAETLETAYNLLSKGGYCIIRIPTCSSYAWKYYGVNWFQLDAPRHFFIHSVESMEYLAKKTNFEIEECLFDSTHHQFTISERYKMDKKLSERVYNSLPGKFYNIFEKLFYSWKARKLNAAKMGDQAIFYLRKN